MPSGPAGTAKARHTPINLYIAKAQNCQPVLSRRPAGSARAGPAVDAAKALAEVPEDIEGTARPAGEAPDVGAHEYRARR